MQIPQQPPEEEQRQASQPLYEFVSDSSSPAEQKKPVPSEETSSQHPDAQATTSGIDRPPPSAEAIRQGLVYPPPPSFYQNTEEPPAPPLPLPPQASGAAPFPPSGALPFVPPVDYHTNGAGTERISPPPFIPIPPPVQGPPVRKSRKWMWIVLALLGGVLVLSCGLCTWAGYLMIAPTVQDEIKAQSLVNNYYDAIQARNYNDAYSYLAPSPQGSIKGLTRTQFTQQAEKRDSQYGVVRTYVPGQPSLPTGSSANSSDSLNLSHLTITVNVTRPHLTYSVVLSLEKIKGTWKIVDFGSI